MNRKRLLTEKAEVVIRELSMPDPAREDPDKQRA
jgi:hypothetical protein